MQNSVPDKANVLALPPLIYATAFVLGLLLHLAFPMHFLPSALVRWLGSFCMLIAGLIVVAALRALRRAQTTFDVAKPTTALVTEGPFRYSRNPMYVSLTLLYFGVTCLMNRNRSDQIRNHRKLINRQMVTVRLSNLLVKPRSTRAIKRLHCIETYTYIALQCLKFISPVKT